MTGVYLHDRIAAAAVALFAFCINATETQASPVVLKSAAVFSYAVTLDSELSLPEAFESGALSFGGDGPYRPHETIVFPGREGWGFNYYRISLKNHTVEDLTFHISGDLTAEWDVPLSFLESQWDNGYNHHQFYVQADLNIGAHHGGISNMLFRDRLFGPSFMSRTSVEDEIVSPLSGEGERSFSYDLRLEPGDSVHISFRTAANVNPVPVPAPLGLLGGASLVLGTLALRRRQR